MPVATRLAEKGKTERFYSAPLVGAGLLDWSERGLDLLCARRRAHVADENDFRALRMKPEMKAAQRRQKACGIVIRHIDGSPGRTSVEAWPIELADDLDAELRAYALHFSH